ncbi:MAG: PAS domain S-box protein, partial [Micropepsaceae bacterium]
MEVFWHTFVAVVQAAVGVLGLAITVHALSLRGRLSRARVELAAVTSDLSETQRIGRMGSWQWDIRTNGLVWSEQVYRTFGVEQRSAPTFEFYIQLIHPDDRAELVETIRCAVAEGAPYQVRHRIVRPDGEVRTISAHGEVERDGGVPARMVGICQDVTDLVRLQNEADDQRRTLRGVMDNLFVFVGMFETNGVVAYANHASVEAWGFKRDDIVGKPVWDVFFWAYSAESQARVRDAIARAADGEVVRGDYVVRAGEDSYITIDAIFAPLRDRDGRVVQVIGSAVDVTARKQAEQAAKASETRLRTIVESQPECVKVLDSQCRLIDMNTAGLRIVGANSIDELRGSSVLDLIDARYHQAYIETVERVFRGETTQLQFEIVSRGGTRRWMEQQAAPLFDAARPDRVFEMIAVTRDVSERVLMEQSSQRIRELLEQAQRIAGVGSWEWDFAPTKTIRPSQNP